MIELSRGKSANAVLAARIRIANVEICTSRYKNVPLPNTADAITDSSVSVSVGYAWRRWASSEMAKKNVPRITPIHVRVIAAFFDSGLRNAGTPLEIASVPDRAMAPDE